MNQLFDIELYKLHEQYDSHEDIGCSCGMKCYTRFSDLNSIDLIKAAMFVVSRAEDAEFCKNKLRYMIHTLRVQRLSIARLCIRVILDEQFPGILKGKAKKVLSNLGNL